jgi:ATP-dependent exoDNAse (exonuclease V) alpha subunit
VAYAITVHKSQGLTVGRAVLDISEKDFSPGLTYVAISRVKTLAGILFDNVFDFERFRPRHSERALMRLADITRRASQHEV